MNWRDYITSTPGVLGGKPAVKGTRLAVDFILGLFASGWTMDQVLSNYPFPEYRFRASGVRLRCGRYTRQHRISAPCRFVGMRFLADENFPLDSSRYLENVGHDVDIVVGELPPIPDKTILARAVSSQRVLLTLDTDFGSLIYRDRLTPPLAVILFRITLLLRWNRR